jgi:hypothetical protein
MPLRVLDLFSGIGAFSLGLERAGMRIVEAGGAHPADQGLTETLTRDGYTAAGKRRLVEFWREAARREKATNAR